MKIIYASLHHTGGVANNRFASTKHLTFNDINQYHKSRWPNFQSSLGYYTGYNFVVKGNDWFQTRAIGEETAAQKGYNFDTISVCIIGNYNKLSTGSFVDEMDAGSERTVKWLLGKLYAGDFTEFVLYDSVVEVDIKMHNIVPHRHFSITDCNGTSLPDSWGRDLTERDVKARLSIFSILRDLYLRLVDATRLAKRNATASLVKYPPRASCLDEDVKG